MAKVGVVGARGRMGREVVGVITEALLDAARQLTLRIGGDPSVYQSSSPPSIQKSKRSVPRRRAG